MSLASAAGHAEATANIPAEYARATDYLEFGRGILPAAQSGDAVAQYHLYLLINRCQTSWSAYFREGKDGTSTLEQATTKLRARYRGVELEEQLESVREDYAKCRSWFNAREELGYWNRWMDEAARSGEPHALMYTGRLMLGDDPRSEKRAAGLALIKRAMRSKDPELLMIYGDLQNRLILVPREEGELYSAGDIERLAWWVVACRRDHGCGGQEWLGRICDREPECMKRGALDWIERQVTSRQAEIHARASMIEAALDSDDWESLGL